jgi:hypothetical protein
MLAHAKNDEIITIYFFFSPPICMPKSKESKLLPHPYVFNKIIS